MAEDVGFYYDEEEKLTVLSISKLQIRAGERVAVLGRNGSGKSTLLQLLAGMQEPQQGSILLDDMPSIIWTRPTCVATCSCLASRRGCSLAPCGTTS
jgi:ABC-type transport system involved in cytochrome bd biosynthesis fused ATPase/permease subunit